MLVPSVVPLETKYLTSHLTPAKQHQIVIFFPRLHGLGMRLEQLLDFIIGQLARSSSCTRVGHLTRPIPSRRLWNPSPMSNKSIAFAKKRREGVDEVGGVGGRESCQISTTCSKEQTRFKSRRESGNTANLLWRCTEVSWGRNWCRTSRPETENTREHHHHTLSL